MSNQYWQAVLKLITEIRHLYTPIQPTVKCSIEGVKYREFLPHHLLLPYIYCYWELRTTKILKDPFSYRVVADGCIDIFFEINKPKENFIMGFCKKYTEFPLDNSFHYVGIRFLPTMLPQIFQVNAFELSNQFKNLNEVLPHTADFINSSFKNIVNQEKIRQLFDNYFLDIITTIKFNDDSRLYNAIRCILKNHGVITIETDLDTGISPRQLRRIFKYYIGDTAKTFSKVVRFQNILRAKPSKQSLKQNKLFYDIGYYDQAHFIKDFKNFYGVTPTKAFGR